MLSWRLDPDEKQRGDEDQQRTDLEHDGEERGELVEEAVDDGPPDPRGQNVGPVPLQAVEGFVFAEAVDEVPSAP